jgi:hypothetical protein
VQLGAHVSTAGGIHTAIDRIEAIGGDCVQIFTQSPRAWRPTNHDPANFKRFKERRAEAGIGGVVCHAVYLINLASPNDELYEKSVAALENTVDVASGIEADGVVFHVGSHQGAGFEVSLKRVVPALHKGAETLLGDHLAADREHRRHRRHHWPLDRRARRALPRPERPRAARDLPRLVPPLRFRLRRHEPRGARPPARRGRPSGSASSGCGRCT